MSDVPKRSYNSSEKFVDSFLRNESYIAVADELGIKPTSVVVRMYTLRKNGVNLTPKSNGGRRGRPKMDVDKLNGIIENSNPVE